MQETHSITRPELTAIIDGEQTFHGASQLWYEGEWQQKAGCGPTAAAMLVSYLAQTRSECRALYPARSWEKRDFLPLMDALWLHVTPGKKGVNTLRIFTKGLAAFAAEKGVALPLRSLDVPAFRLARPSISQCEAFLRTALAGDSPVAFLNLHNGRLKNLDSWHWVLITALTGRSDGPLLCTILDGGEEKTIDFALWMHSTRGGGGFVCAPKA